MILLLEKRKSKIYSILGTLLSGIMILVLNFVIVTWLQRNTVEWIVDMVISVCFMILCIWVICEVDFFSAVGYGMVGFVAGELAASAEWLIKLLAYRWRYFVECGSNGYIDYFFWGDVWAFLLFRTKNFRAFYTYGKTADSDICSSCIACN